VSELFLCRFVKDLDETSLSDDDGGVGLKKKLAYVFPSSSSAVPGKLKMASTFLFSLLV
jgi:hypothetical protein